MSCTVNTNDANFIPPINPNEIESLSCYSWEELVQQGQKAVVPCVMATICKLGKNNFSIYETIHFIRYQQYNPPIIDPPMPFGKDPLTRLPIIEITHLFAKVFTIGKKEDGSIGRLPCTSPTFYKLPSFLSENLQTLAYEGSNLHLEDRNKDIAAQYQYTIGANFLTNHQEEEAERWLHCAAVRGSGAAAKLLLKVKENKQH